MHRKNIGKISIVAITFVSLSLGFFLLSQISSGYLFHKRSGENILIENVIAKSEDPQTESKTDNLNQRVIVTDGSDGVIPGQGKAILADLSAMKITLFKDGVIDSELEIMAKGTEGSRYETPIGIYKIETKEVKHRVSVRDIYMPYSMQFFGNFFIHGMPYYFDGTPLRDGDSGGCMRLSSEDAKKVFAFAEVGTPVFVIEPGESESSANIPQEFFDAAKRADKKDNQTPDISALSYLVADLNSGFVFSEKDAGKEAPIRQLSNLMSAVVSEEIFRDDHQFAVEGYDIKNQSLQPGDIFTATELLRPLILEHDITAATAATSDVGEGMFIGLMNRKAKAIGMTSSHFADVTGESSKNVSTADDMFHFVKYVYKKHTPLAKITTWTTSSLPQTFAHQSYSWKSTNLFTADESLILSDSVQVEGVGNIAAAFTVEMSGKKIPLALIVLGSQNLEGDTQALLEWTKANYGGENVATADTL